MEMKIGHGMANHGPEPHAALRLVSCGSLSFFECQPALFLKLFLFFDGRRTGDGGEGAEGGKRP